MTPRPPSLQPRPLQTKRFDVFEQRVVRSTPFGPMATYVVNFLRTDDVFPTLVVGAMFLVQMKGEWLLSHLLIEDEARRNGVATEIVSFYEERLGPLAACWCSDEGIAFARKYVERFGPRPKWQIGSTPEMDAIVDRVLSPGGPK